jgi:L,D-peptidoglycan transpeptidase YkuD (ErfK/YbiS/YcfS/YnhG family)
MSIALAGGAFAAAGPPANAASDPEANTASEPPAKAAPGPASAAAFDPCAAIARGALRYGTGTAARLVFALSSGYASNHVVVTECVRNGRAWVKVTETAGRAGRNGFAAPGAKREGDGKSPTGSFTFTEAFGRANPGTRLAYRTLRDSGDCWGATPGASHYNDYYSGTCRAADENLSSIMQLGPYRQAAVIDYNRPNAVAGRGSAIFFHVGGVTPTAGCVSIAEPVLVGILRSLAPGDRMIMGPRSEIFRA